MNFKNLREKSQKSQQLLAEEIGVKRTTLTMWENGKSNPPLNKIPLLANALNVSELEIIQCFHRDLQESIEHKQGIRREKVLKIKK